MEDLIIVSDFDGTITSEDTLYKFFKMYAKTSWLEVEKMWSEGKIGSMECLIRQFELVEGLNKELIENYISTIELDSYFKKFIQKNKYDFIIVSDGIDYFIKEILRKNNIENISIVSNHAEFIEKDFSISFPNKNPLCKNKSGTCKCSIVNNLRKKYKKIIYIGDGRSDFCVSDKADILYAKGNLLKYCKKNNINHIEFNNFKDIIYSLSLN